MSVDIFFKPQEVPIQRVQFQGLIFDVLRLDKIHEGASGNKYFKLKYNFLEAEQKGYKTVLTFGGAFSNHIVATAISSKACGFKSIGIIRGEELSNPTLSLAQQYGMELKFISREKYRNKDSSDYIEELLDQYGMPYLIPEGGTNENAIRGAREIHEHIPPHYNMIATCFGTGGTLAGLIKGKNQNQKVMGFSVLKGEWVKKALEDLLQSTYENWELLTDYHFGGYAKWKPDLIDFMKSFYEETSIPLDPVYNGKMMYGIWMEWKQGNILSTDRILAIHSGGLQGIEGFNRRFAFDLAEK